MAGMQCGSSENVPDRARLSRGPQKAPLLRLLGCSLVRRGVGNTLYRWNRPSPSLCKSCWQTSPGKWEGGGVGATSATDLPTLAFTGVARKEWTLPTSGPLSTIAMPEICPRSLMLLAEITKRLESAGNSVLRSVITRFCQMKPWDQLKPESRVLPTTWSRLLMPVAKAAKSPGRVRRFVTAPSAPFCQTAA